MTNMANPQKVYEFEILERRKYIVQGDGRTEFEAKQDAIERFHRLAKSGELSPFDISTPTVIKQVGVRKS